MTDDLTPPIEQSDFDEFNLNEAPKWPKVVGIISIIWALIGLTCGGIGMASSLLFAPMMESQLNGDPLPPTMVLTPADYALGAFGLIMAAVLVVGGIMLIMRKRGARALHLVYGLGAIPSLIISTIINFGKQEAAQQWAQDYPDNPMAQQMAAGGDAGQAIGMIIAVVLTMFFMLYPLFCIIWFGLVKNKHEQMTGGVEEVY